MLLENFRKTGKNVPSAKKAQKIQNLISILSTPVGARASTRSNGRYIYIRSPNKFRVKNHNFVRCVSIFMKLWEFMLSTMIFHLTIVTKFFEHPKCTNSEPIFAGIFLLSLLFSFELRVVCGFCFVQNTLLENDKSLEKNPSKKIFFGWSSKNLRKKFCRFLIMYSQQRKIRTQTSIET